MQEKKESIMSEGGIEKSDLRITVWHHKDMFCHTLIANIDHWTNVVPRSEILRAMFGSLQHFLGAILNF